MSVHDGGGAQSEELASTLPAPKIVFIAPAASHPRYHKRVQQLSRSHPVEVFAFSRGYYTQNTFPETTPFVHLGRIQDGKYFRRITKLFAAARAIQSQSEPEPDQDRLFYAMSLDCLLIARLSGLTRGYYEVGDLRTAEGAGRLACFLERILFRYVRGLVLTSKYFYDGFYANRGLLPPSRVHVIDNKVSGDLADRRPLDRKQVSERIVIGLVGLFRYRRPIELLLEFVRQRPDTHVLECFGDGPLRDLVDDAACENIRNHGPFKNPDELPAIYETIDLNFVVYDSASKNVRLALPNKLFESAFFGVPIVCCHDTAVGGAADEWGIGGVLRIDTNEHFEADLQAIDQEWLAKRAATCLTIPSSDLLDDGAEVLAKMLSESVG